MVDNKILYSEHDGVHFLRFQGDILHTLAPAFDRFLQRITEDPGTTSYLIDLTETSSIDSTMLGLLARVAKKVRDMNGPPPTLVCSSEDIIDLLQGIGFDQVFQMVACDGTPLGDAQALDLEETDHHSLARTMLDAHQELIGLKDENRLLFEDVIQLLEKSLERSQQ